EQNNIAERYPEPNLAQRKYGYNAFVNFTPNEKVSIGLSAGGQNSIAQGAFLENLVTPLNTRTSISNYVDLRAKIHGLNAQIGYQGGTQDASKGFNGYKYNFGTLDATAEYDFTFSNFSIKPGINYRSANYDDSPYTNISQNQGFINGSKVLTNFAGSLRAEFDNKKFFRFVAAGRLDGYNAPKDIYFSYEVAAYVKPSEKHLLRAVVSRGYRGPTMYDVYGSQIVPVGTISVAPGVDLLANAQLKGSNNLNLQKVDLFELGYRAKATDFLYFDLDLFYQISRNYNLLTGVPQVVDMSKGQIILTQTIRNINLVAYQRGATFAANLALKNIQIKPFVTLQYTALECSPVGRDSATVADNTTNIADSRNTPKFFGGFYANYQPISKLNINLNGYYFGPYTYTNLYTQLGGSTSNNGNVNVSGKFILNLKIGYKVLDKLEVFINARNAFNATSYEFAKTDATSGLYMLGANFEF
ncbi:MAG: TonB-dependent receptor, partial [Cytophagales bacterium]|nr:TonB-dependent receptor [Cytophagales bacterium]